MGESAPDILEATIDDIQQAYKSRAAYLPRIGAVLPRSHRRLRQARAGAQFDYYPQRRGARPGGRELDRVYNATGPVGPLHGIPVIVKDQADVKGLPTTIGSVLFKDYYPDRDSFVVEKLKQAGAFDPRQIDSRRNGRGRHARILIRLDAQSLRSRPHRRRFLRRVGGGGHGQPVCHGDGPGGTGIDPPAGCVELCRGHAHDCGTRQPHRCVRRLAVLGWLARADHPHCRRYGRDPGRHRRLRCRRSAHRLRRWPRRRRALRVFCSKTTIKRTQLGILREPMGIDSEPDSDDFKKISEVFDYAVGELKRRGRRNHRSDRHPATQRTSRQARIPVRATANRRSGIISTGARRRRSSQSPKLRLRRNSAKSPVTPRVVCAPRPTRRNIINI